MKCLCATTRRIARLLTQRYEEALRPANLTPAQFELLSTLAQMPNIPQAKLAEYLALDQTTLSRNLNILVDRIWVARQTNPKDRRQISYDLTPQGKKAWTEAIPLWQFAHDHMHQQLGNAWDATWSTLERLGQAASQDH